MVVRELWKISFYKRKFWIEIIFTNSHKKVEHIENNLWDAPPTAGDRASNLYSPGPSLDKLHSHPSYR